MEQQSKKVIDANRWVPGKYKAKPADWGIAKDKSGNPRVMVLFDYFQKNPTTGADEPTQLMWWGSFTGGAREFTFEALEIMGLKTPPSSMESGAEGKALDSLSDVVIVVKHKTDPQGIVRPEVAFINAANAGVKSNLADGESKAIFASIDAEFMAGRAPAAKTPAQSVMQQGELSEEDVPF